MNKYKIALTCGVFDMFHAGHINLLSEMRKRADKIIVFLHDDKSTFKNKNKFPVQSFSHRVDNLLLSGMINNVVAVEDPSPASAFKKHIEQIGNPKEMIYIRGDDWQDFPAKEVIKELGIKIEFIPYTKGISSTKLRDELSKQ